MNTIKAHLISLIEKACRHLAANAGATESADNSRIHIPQENGKPRISEQELKLMFLELFFADTTMQSYTLSAETPTKEDYRFTENGKKVKPECGTTGQKANIDVVIFNGESRVAMIEFKAGNPDGHSHAKDFIKLREEPDNEIIRIFVEVYTSTNDRTLTNITDKLFNNEYGNIGDNTEYLGFSLNHKNNGCCFIRTSPDKKAIPSNIS